MKMVIQIARAIFGVFLCVNLFTWGAAHLTKRNVPTKTDLFFLINGIVLLGLVILFNYLYNRQKDTV